MTDKRKNNKLLIQIIKFLIVGGTATIIDFSIFFILHDLTKQNTIISNIVGFSISLIYNYIISIKWVFNVKKESKTNFLIFLILSIIGLIINTIIVYIGIEKLKWYSLFCKIAATSIVMIFNFITRKKFLEEDRSKT